MERNNRPLALNSWVDMSGPNSYSAAISAIDEVMDSVKDDYLNDHPFLADFMMKGLYHRIGKQSEQNYVQYERVKPWLTEAHTDYVQGNKTPSELVLFLYVTEPLQSIEIARRTHREWNMYEEVDYPVRSDLDDDPILYTQAIKSEPLYRIKNLNITDRTDQYYVQIDRKRTIRQHFGSKVLTIVRNSLVLHDLDGSMPNEVRRHIREEREDALGRMRHDNDSDYDYDKHSQVLQEHLEEHILNRRSEEPLTWAMPILTTYYSARRNAVKGRLLKFANAPTHEVT